MAVIETPKLSNLISRKIWVVEKSPKKKYLSKKKVSSIVFSNSFAKIVTFTKFLLKKWISVISSLKFNLNDHRENSLQFTVWINATFFPSNQFIVKFFSKTLIWQNFCGKQEIHCHGMQFLFVKSIFKVLT